MTTTGAGSDTLRYRLHLDHADMGEFHRRFDEALARVQSGAGREHPLLIDGPARHLGAGRRS